MRLEFWGTDQEFRQFRKKHKELAEYTTHMDKNLSLKDEYSQTTLEIEKDIEDMKYFKDKLILIVDKMLKRM